MNLYEKFKSACKRLNQHGQSLVLYAIAFPMLFMFVFVGVDMGWYYLNVSRLQNAADAAAIAGANTLAKDKTIPNVKKILLVNDNEYVDNPPTESKDLSAANSAAAEYANKNLSNIGESADAAETTENVVASTITNSWTNKTVTPMETLYQDNDNYYYLVTLNEDIAHFMMPSWFEPMKAEVTAVAKLSVNSGSDESSDKPDDNQVLDNEDVKKLEVLKNKNVIIGNWELQNGYRKANSTDKSKYAENLGYEMYAGAWNHFQDLHNHYDYDSNDKYNVFYRTETVNLSSDVDSNGNKVATTAVATAASINTVNKENYTYNPQNSAGKGNPYEWQRLDSINVDFKQDVRMNDDTTTAGSKYLKEDWDLPLGYPTGVDPLNRMYNGIESNSDSVLREKARSLRIHTTINIENPYPVRSYVKDSYYEEKGFKNRPDTEYPDVLWARIESEPMIYYKTYWTKYPINWSNREFNSVRQLIININQSNTAMETVSVEKDGQEVEETRYKYRPMIFFYDGPERYSITNPLRNSKPVIINFKEDFRGVFYMPNSPVVLLKDGKPITGNGNGVFQGFIVAYDYWELLDENDPESANYTKITENGIDMYVDNTGNVQYKYPDKYKKSYGTYDNFGRTDFTTHGYTVAAESAYNLFFSGVTLYGLTP